MAYRVRTVRDLDEFVRALGAIGHYFGWQPNAEDAERFSKILPLERTLAVLDDGEIVAGAGAYTLELTLPGGPAPCAGVTVVGVLPSHRRRGLALPGARTKARQQGTATAVQADAGARIERAGRIESSGRPGPATRTAGLAGER